MGLAEASITKMVVMDHMDWFDPDTVGLLLLLLLFLMKRLTTFLDRV